MLPVFKLSTRATFAAFVFAALSVGTPLPAADGEPQPAPRLNRIWFFGGGDIGFSSVFTSIAGEENKGGLGVDVKGLISFYQPTWIWEAGLGLAYKRVSGTRPTGFEGTLSMTSAFLELGARYRMGSSWQFGPFLQGHVGGDLSHRPTISPILAGEPSKSFILLSGLQLFYETPHPRLPFRIGGRLLTDINVSNRQLLGIDFSLQVGFSISPTPVEPTISKSLDISLVRAFFKTDSWQLSEKSELVLMDLARILLIHRQEFVRVEIEGHTDKVGTAEYNQELSQKRADAVGKILISQGFPRERMHTHGYGFNRPLVKTGPLDQRRNRRVVLRLFGVKSDSKVGAKIHELMDSSSVDRPESGYEN